MWRREVRQARGQDASAFTVAPPDLRPVAHCGQHGHHLLLLQHPPALPTAEPVVPIAPRRARIEETLQEVAARPSKSS